MTTNPSFSPSPSPSTTTQQQDTTSRSASWWETYVIRYFIGTVVGSAILLFLNTSPLSGLRGKLLPGVTDLNSLDVGMLTLIAAAGLAFCYLASAPILVLHASRSVFLQVKKEMVWALRISQSLIFLSMLIGSLIWEEYVPAILSIGVFLAVLTLQLVPCLFAAHNSAEASHTYYEQLSRARADKEIHRQEYKESYRHLREHGNAFLILFFEGLLGIVLGGLSDGGLAVVALLVWIIPATLVWVHATQLEGRYAGL